MRGRLFRRRFATATGLYLSVALGIVGTIAAARLLGLDGFGQFATVLAIVGLAQTLLDLTVEESLTKFGFRFVAAEEWGKLHRLFRRALELKLIGGALATVVLLALAPFADTLFGSEDEAGKSGNRAVAATKAEAELQAQAKTEVATNEPSDVVLAESATGAAPSFRAPAPSPTPVKPASPPKIGRAHV